MERILITGGAGYIGSVLTRKLLALGHEVVVFDALFYTDVGIRNLENQSSLTTIRADIRDSHTLHESLDGVDTVIHLAALANDPSAELDSKLTRAINLDVYPLLLAEAARRKVRLFINLSSIGVYGINFDNNVSEDFPLNPLTEYSICKAKSEAIVRDLNSNTFTTVSLRCGTVCGWSPRMRFDLSTNTLTARAIVDRKLNVWGGDQRRPQIHVEDVTDFIIALLTTSAEKIGGKVFNAAGQNTTVREIAETIREVMGGDLELVDCPPREDERTYNVSSEKIRKELGLSPRRTIHDAVKDILEAYKKGLWIDPDDSIYHNVKRMKSITKSLAL